MKDYTGNFWGDLTSDEQDELLLVAKTIDARTGCNVLSGECIIDFEGYEVSIAGQAIPCYESGMLSDVEILIDDEAIFYNPSK